MHRGDPDDEVLVAWQCYQRVRAAYAADKPADGKQVAETVATFPGCPIKEIARLGRTLRRWKDTYLGYFTTGGADNGGTEAINGIIELHRRIARGYRNPDSYRGISPAGELRFRGSSADCQDMGEVTVFRRRGDDGQATGGSAGCEALDADRLGEPVPIATLIARAFGVEGQARPGSSRGPGDAPGAPAGSAGRRRHLHVVPDEG